MSYYFLYSLFYLLTNHKYTYSSINFLNVPKHKTILIEVFIPSFLKSAVLFTFWTNRKWNRANIARFYLTMKMT